MARLKTFNNRRQSKQRIMEAAFAINRKRECKIINLALSYDMTDRRLRQLGYSKRAIRDVRKSQNFLKNYGYNLHRMGDAFSRLRQAAEQSQETFRRFSESAIAVQAISRLNRGGIVGRESNLVIIDEGSFADIENRVLGVKVNASCRSRSPRQRHLHHLSYNNTPSKDWAND